MYSYITFLILLIFLLCPLLRQLNFVPSDFLCAIVTFLYVIDQSTIIYLFHHMTYFLINAEKWKQDPYYFSVSLNFKNNIIFSP